MGIMTIYGLIAVCGAVTIIFQNNSYHIDHIDHIDHINHIDHIEDHSEDLGTDT